MFQWYLFRTSIIPGTWYSSCYIQLSIETIWFNSYAIHANRPKWLEIFLRFSSLKSSHFIRSLWFTRKSFSWIWHLHCIVFLKDYSCKILEILLNPFTCTFVNEMSLIFPMHILFYVIFYELVHFYLVYWPGIIPIVLFTYRYISSSFVQLLYCVFSPLWMTIILHKVVHIQYIPVYMYNCIYVCESYCTLVFNTFCD